MAAGPGFAHLRRRRDALRVLVVVLAIATLVGPAAVGNVARAQTAGADALPMPTGPPPVDATAPDGVPAAVDAPVPDMSKLPPPPTTTTTAPAKPGQELVDKRTATSKTFVGDQPGQLKTTLYPDPVHFKDAQGRWVDIDPALGPSQNGRRSDKANAFDLSLADSSTDAAVARLAVDDKHSVGFSLDGAAKVTGKADAKSVTYAKVKKDTDMRLTSKAKGLKEELILATKAAPDRYVFPLQLKGLTASLDAAGNVLYRDEAGAVRARTPHGFMTGAKVDPRSGEAPHLPGRDLRPHPLG
ncbi:MAG: hypothetical protein ACRD2W_25270 [Acidimicrobiales bacterium]